MDSKATRRKIAPMIRILFHPVEVGSDVDEAQPEVSPATITPGHPQLPLGLTSAWQGASEAAPGIAESALATPETWI